MRDELLKGTVVLILFQGLSELHLRLCLVGSWCLLFPAAWPCWGCMGQWWPSHPALFLWGAVQGVELCLLSAVT